MNYKSFLYSFFEITLHFLYNILQHISKLFSFLKSLSEESRVELYKHLYIDAFENLSCLEQLLCTNISHFEKLFDISKAIAEIFGSDLRDQGFTLA
jgi:hypothetical protein